MNGVSLFSSAGIAETYFSESGINIKVASELIKKRCMLHQWLYPDCEMINGDIRDDSVFNKIVNSIQKYKCNFLIATPPCQGMSSLGKKEYSTDERNYLIFYALKIIDLFKFDFILIENVPKFLKLKFPYEGKQVFLIDILQDKYGSEYNISGQVLNAQDYGVPQSRPRCIIRLYKKGLKWSLPKKQKIITLRQAIGNLPSLESGESSNLKWHFAKIHNEREIVAMRHTPSGKSALYNEFYYPKKSDGSPIKGFHNTYKRMIWDAPCPARAMNNGNMGGHNNVHPGRLLSDGTYSDARVLTLRELFIVSSLPADWSLPTWVTDNLIREVIGEAIPPRFSQEIIEGIGKE